MRITQLALAAVAPGLTPNPPVPQHPDPPAVEFLCRHVNQVRTKTIKHQTHPGWFTDPVARDLFRDLHLGSDAEFGTAADTLTKRLAARMDARTRRGLLVFVRADDGAERFGGVLKLDVEADSAGVLRRLESGDARLDVVEDLLTGPDDLQKAALTSSVLPSGRVMVVDRMTHAAAYFPGAFGISTAARPGAGASVLLWALDQIRPELAAPVARALPKVSAGEPAEVLDALQAEIPEFAGEVKAAVADVLDRHDPPVGYIETARPPTVKVVAGEITISGPLSAMRDLVSVAPADPETWTVQVASRGEPEWLYPNAGRFHP